MSASIVRRIFTDAIRAVHPQSILPGYIQADERLIRIAGKSIQRNLTENIIVIACGKASAAMAEEACSILKGMIAKCICITKYGHGLPVKNMDCIEAGHPYPDENSMKAGSIVSNMAEQLGKNDVVLLLLSGGASSLMADRPDECSAESIRELNKLLVNSGASINEINTVRKHLSNIKGGYLSKLIYPATVHALIISDVPGNKLADIGSGLTVADPTRFRDAMAVLQRYHLADKVPAPVLNHLKKGMKGLIHETPKPGSKYFSKTYNTIIASNHTALSAAEVSAADAGFFVKRVKKQLQGDTRKAAIRISRSLLKYDGKLPVCIMWGGETTIQVSGNGTGGRNQHLALCILDLMIKKWKRPGKFTVLCAGTDGTDGPTEAAGAIIDSAMLSRKEITTGQIRSCLSAFNSTLFFKEHDALVITGATQTNVMDMVIAIIE